MKKKKRMSKELSIGIFVVVVLIVGYFGLNFLKNKNVFGGDYTIKAVFESASGLDKGSSVTIKGYKVGSVEAIYLNMKTQCLEVKMNIEGKYKIPSNSTASVGSASLLGGKEIVIEIGDVGGEILKGGSVIQTVEKSDMMSTVGSKVTTLSDSLEVIMGKFSTTLSSVNNTLSEENVEALSSTFASLKGISSDLNQITATQGKNIQNSLANLAELTQTLNESAPELQRSLANIAELSDSLKVSAPTLIANANSAVAELQDILTQINSGEGTANKLLTDEELYVNITTALANLSILIDDITENPKKYINVSVF